MLSELIFFQPFDDASGKSSVLVVAFGDEGLGCCDEKPGDQQGRENDSRTALSCLGGEQQHGLAMKTTDHPGRTGGKERLLQMFVADTKAQQITTGKRKSSPCTASQARTEAVGLARGFATAEAAAGNALRGRIKE